MKKLVLLIIILLATYGVSFGATTTTNYSLTKPTAGDTGWGDSVNTNFDTIDSQMKTNADAIDTKQDIIVEGGIPDDTIVEADFKAVDTAADEECLTYETTTGDFEWQTCASGSFALDTTTLTVEGTANEITSSAGAQDLTTDRTWTLGIASPLVLSSKIVELPNGTALTGTDCDADNEAGRIFVDTDATTGQQLYVCEDSGSGGTWVVQGDGTGGTTAQDDVGDPDAATSISFDDTETFTLANAQNTAGGFFIIANSVADITNDVSLIDLTFTDDGDANGYYLRGYDNSAGDIQWYIGANGDADFGGAVTATSFSADASANPTTSYTDSDTADNDVSAKAAVNCTNTGSGTEDCNYTISQQVSGTMTEAARFEPASGLTLSGNLTTDNGVVFIKEQADADTDVAGYGQLWVNTASPNELWFTNDAGTDTQLGTGSGGGITNLTLPIQSAKITGAFVTNGDASQGAQIDAGGGGWKLLFDATTDEGAVWQFVMPDNYSSTPTLTVHFSMASGEANEVEFEGSIMCYTTGTDTADIDTASFAAVDVGTATTVSATAGEAYQQAITLTDDSCAAGDMVWIQLSTDADDATNDDATGDREVIGLEFGYTGS